MVAVVQLVEHLVVVQDVAGSSPVSHPDIGSQLFAEALYVCAANSSRSCTVKWLIRSWWLFAA